MRNGFSNLNVKKKSVSFYKWKGNFGQFSWENLLSTTNERTQMCERLLCMLKYFQILLWLQKAKHFSKYLLFSIATSTNKLLWIGFGFNWLKQLSSKSILSLEKKRKFRIENMKKSREKKSLEQQVCFA